ncbi:MAG: PilZ domain-containing protein [Candidatus Omnitrophota bacterium]
MDKEFGGTERRKHVRWAEKFPSEFIFCSNFVAPGLPKKLKGTIINISSSGACAKVENFEEKWKESLRSGIIRVIIKAAISKNESQIKALAKVVWVKKHVEGGSIFDMGMEFIDITTRDRDILTESILDSFLEGV